MNKKKLPTTVSSSLQRLRAMAHSAAPTDPIYSSGLSVTSVRLPPSGGDPSEVRRNLAAERGLWHLFDSPIDRRIREMYEQGLDPLGVSLPDEEMSE